METPEQKRVTGHWSLVTRSFTKNREKAKGVFVWYLCLLLVSRLCCRVTGGCDIM